MFVLDCVPRSISTRHRRRMDSGIAPSLTMSGPLSDKLWPRMIFLSSATWSSIVMLQMIAMHSASSAVCSHAASINTYTSQTRVHGHVLDVVAIMDTSKLVSNIDDTDPGPCDHLARLTCGNFGNTDSETTFCGKRVKQVLQMTDSSWRVLPGNRINVFHTRGQVKRITFYSNSGKFIRNKNIEICQRDNKSQDNLGSVIASLFKVTE